MMKPVCSVIIPVYKRKEWIGRCLEKLKHQKSAPHFEIIIVDDGSPNFRELETIINHALNDSTIDHKILCIKNGGPARARNHGVKHALGNILCFLDDDSLPDENWLNEVHTSFSSPEISVVSGPARSFDRSNPLPLLLEKHLYNGKTFATCNIAYRKNVFNGLNGFDESFREPSWEDNDLGLRAAWQGLKHIYNPNAIVYHPHEATLEEYRDKCRINGRGAVTFSKKYLKTRTLWALITPIAMSRRIVCILSPMFWLSSRPNAAYVKFTWSWYSLKGYLHALLSS